MLQYIKTKEDLKKTGRLSTTPFYVFSLNVTPPFEKKITNLDQCLYKKMKLSMNKVNGFGILTFLFHSFSRARAKLIDSV